MPISKDSALAALRKVMDPELHRDLVSLDMVKDLAVDGTAVSLKVELTTPACPLKDTIGKDVEAALKAAGATSVKIAWGAQVRSAPGAAQGQIAPGVKNIILVGAGKGGVGKSTVAINLAVSLAQSGAKVGILDADIYGPSVPILTGLTERPTSVDGKRITPLHAHGLSVMSIGFLIDPDQALIWRGPMATGALLQLLRDVDWGELDYLILDLPPGTGDIPLTSGPERQGGRGGAGLHPAGRGAGRRHPRQAHVRQGQHPGPRPGREHVGLHLPALPARDRHLRQGRRQQGRREDGDPLPRRGAHRPRHPPGRRPGACRSAPAPRTARRPRPSRPWPATWPAR